MVEVFKTNISGRANAHLAEGGLMLSYPHLMVSFDLEDPDKVLRVESIGEVDKLGVMMYFKKMGYVIQSLK